MQRSLCNRAIIAAALTLSLLLSGCGAAWRLAYNQGPTLTYWWMDGYVDFNDDQKPRVRQQIDQFFRWNRREQMPDYADLFGRAGSQVLDPVLTPQHMCGLAAEARQRLWTVFEHALPALGELAVSLTPEQIRNMEKRFTKNNDKFRDEYLRNRDDRLRAQTKKALERAEMVYGGLDDGQQERVAQLVAASPYDPEAWLAERRLIQQELLQTLRELQASGATPAQAQQALRRVAQHIERSPREAYRAQSRAVWDYNCAFAAQLHNATKPAQRQHAAQRLKRWEQDARGLHAAAR